MATIHVSDFTSFLGAVKTTNADVILDADLDAIGWGPQVTNWTCQSVDGGGHVIRNLQHNIPYGYSLFRLTNTNGCIISNVKFLNLNLIPPNPWGSSFIYGAAGTNYIRNCEFQGSVKTGALIDGTVTISQSTFSFELGSYGRVLNLAGKDSAPAQTFVNECYFDCNSGDEEYFTHTIISFTYPAFAIVSNCYFKGKLKVISNAAIAIDGVINNCVVNIEFTPKDSTINTLNIGNSNIGLSGTTLYNTSKVNGSLTVTTQTDLVGLSDTDLKYPEGLTAIPPTGFPLMLQAWKIKNGINDGYPYRHVWFPNDIDYGNFYYNGTNLRKCYYKNKQGVISEITTVTYTND